MVVGVGRSSRGCREEKKREVKGNVPKTSPDGPLYRYCSCFRNKQNSGVILSVHPQVLVL